MTATKKKNRILTLRNVTDIMGHDNRGSSLVMALVVVAFVAVLGVTIITMALSALKIRTMDGRSRGAYYNADNIVDEIRAGLGNDAYAQVTDSYEYIVTNLLTVNSDAIIMMDNDTANKALRKKFYCLLGDKLFGSCMEAGIILDMNMFYESMEEELTGVNLAALSTVLSNYISDTYTTDANLKVKIEAHKAPVFKKEFGEVTSIAIRDVTVTYENVKTDYFSEITTDFVIKFPKDELLDLVHDSNDVLISFKDYSFVTDENLVSSVATGINGGMYAYKDINLFGSKAAASAYGINLNGRYNLVSGSNVNVGIGTENYKAKLNFGGKNMWAQNVELRGSDLYVSPTSSVYVRDDLTFTATSDDAAYPNSAKIDGNYYGYSIEGYGINASSSSPAVSSAIIVNSQSTRLDLSSVKTLVLGGYGWVVYNEAANGYYRTGESIAIRDNQIAYLLPSDWPTGDLLNYFFGKCLLGMPMTISNVEHIGTEDVTVLYYNFKSGDDASRFFRALFVDDEFDSLCTESGLTTEFEKQRAQAIRERIKQEVDATYTAYLSGGAFVNVNPAARVYAKGIVRSDAEATTDTIKDYNSIGDDKVKQLYNNSTMRYRLVKSLLIELPDDWNYDSAQWTDAKIAGKVLNYGNMKYTYTINSPEDLNKAALENILIGKGKIDSNYFYYVEDEHGNNAKDYMVYVSNGDVTISTLPIRKGMVITTGNVNADADFEGSILALGNIGITGGNYTANPTMIEEIMENIPGILGYFDNRNNVTIGRHLGYNDGVVSSGDADDTDNSLSGYNPSDCVAIENYRKSGYVE